VQSQEFGPAKWSVAQRAAGVDDTALDRAFAGGSILRTHVLRPTWHFVLPADIRWMLELTASRVQAASASYYRQEGLDETVRGSCTALLAEALRGGIQLTRKELGDILSRAGVAVNRAQLGLILMHAELSGVICSGPPRGKQHTYALLAERAPQARRLTRDEALAKLTLRYFTSHGPATVQDFAWWSSLTAAEAKKGLDMVGAQLDREIIGGAAYWFAPPSPPDVPPSPSVVLLQGYDEYMVGYRESRGVIDLSGLAGSLPPPRGIFNPLVILDSQVAGHWKRTVKRDSVVVEVALARPFDEAQRDALQAAVDSYGEFVGLTVATIVKVF
jgi:hypothetical protein